MPVKNFYLFAKFLLPAHAKKMYNFGSGLTSQSNCCGGTKNVLPSSIQAKLQLKNECNVLFYNGL